MAQDLDLKIRISADGKAALGGLRDLDRGMQQLEATAKKVGAAVAAYLSFDFLAGASRALFDATAQLQAFEGRFAALAGSAQAGAAQMAYVQETAKRLSMDLNVARESYAQLLTLQNAGLATQEQARALMEGYGKAAIMTGASSAQLQQSMAGLAQAMAMGTVSTENAMQALEPIPGLQKKVADALKMSIAEMKDAWEKGTISSQQFGDAVAKALNEMGKGAETMANTLGPTLQRVKNEWQLLLETLGDRSGFAEAAAAILSALETMLGDAKALIQSGWISDAFRAEIDYIKSAWADLGNALADDRFFDDVRANWESLWQGIKDAAGDLGQNLRTVFADFPEIIAGFTVIAASQIAVWVADLGVAWATLKATFANAWEGMKAFLANTLNSMIQAVAAAVNSMGQLLGGFLAGAAEKLRALPEFLHMGSVADALAAGAARVEQSTQQWVDAANQRAAASQAESAAVIAANTAEVDAVRQAAAASKTASEQAAQQTVLELNQRTQARDAAIAQAQAVRQGAAAHQAETPAIAANAAASAANAAESDKVAKAKKAAADAAARAAQALAEDLAALVADTAALEALTASYLTFNDATVSMTRIETELSRLNPALRDQARAKAIAELNAEVAKRLYALEYEAQLDAREATARLQGTEALRLYTAQKQVETVLRERNTGALEQETAKVVEQRLAAEDLAEAADDVADAYKDSLTPLEKYAAELTRIAQIEETLKATEGAWTDIAQRGIAQLRKEAEAALAKADPMAKAYQQAANDIQHSWVGMWEGVLSGNMDSFKDFANSLKKIFLRMLAEMAAYASQGILVPIIGLAGGLAGLGGGLSGLGGTGGMGGTGGIGGMMSGMSALSGLGGMLGLTGGLFGGFGGGMALGTSLIANGGFFGSMGTALGAAGSFAGSGGLGGLMSAIGTVAPYLAAIAAVVAVIYSLTRKTPHPSSIATAGGFINSENGPDYPGKGGGVAGASGLIYGYDWGHTDPKDAEALRDAFLQIDAALKALIPTADLAGVKLGEYGYTAEGFVAALHGYVDSMEEATAWFIKDWVQAAADMGAVSQTISTILMGMEGEAEAIIKGLAALLQLEAFTKSDLAGDAQKVLDAAQQTALEKLASQRTALEELAAAFDGSSAKAQELAAASAALYQSELEMIIAIEQAAREITALFESTMEGIRTDLMTPDQKQEYYQDQITQAWQALLNATDPADIAQAAEDLNRAYNQFWDTLSEQEKGQFQQEILARLQEAERIAAEKLAEVQQQIIEQHEQTAQIIADALEAAARKAAEAIQVAAEAAQAAAEAAQAAAERARDAINDVRNAPGAAGGMAGGGIVPGAWNGRTGRAGDTVLTALTPGEAVIPRATTQQHAPLIAALLRDQVRYAAAGFGPGGADPETWRVWTGPSRVNPNPRRTGAADLAANADALDNAASAAADAARAVAAFNQELTRAIAQFGLADDALAALELDYWYEDTVARAREVGGDLALVEQLYGLKREQLAKEHAQAILDTWQDLNNAIQSARAQIGNAMLAIRRQQPGWSETAYQAGEVSRLRGALDAAATPTEKIEVIEQLQEAIAARYQAEVEQIQAVQSTMQTTYDLQESALETTRAIVKQIADYLSGLRLSDKSPLDPLRKLEEAQRQYEKTLGLARGGEAQAGQDITQAADAYLQAAREYYASTDAYARRFSTVVADLEALQGVTFTDATAASAASASRAASEFYPVELSDSANEALAQLAQLDELLAELQDEAAAQRDADLATAQTSAKQTIHAIEQGSQAIVAAILGRPMTGEPALAATERLLLGATPPPVDQRTKPGWSTRPVGNYAQYPVALGWDWEVGNPEIGSKTNTPGLDLKTVQRAVAEINQQMDDWADPRPATVQIELARAVTQAVTQAVDAGTAQAVTQAVTQAVDAGTAQAVTQAVTQAVDAGTAQAVTQAVTQAVDAGTAQAVTQAVTQAVDAGTAQAVTQAVTQNFGGKRLVIAGYARGGYAPEGLALVGERGPELIDLAHPARIYSHADSRALMVRDSPETVAELKALIRLQASANQQLLSKLDAVEARLAGIESKARLEAAA